MKLDITGLYDIGPKHSIRTFSGIYIDLACPTEDMIYIQDIAHALSMQPRWTGHLPKLYSVAQHSIECCNMAHPKDKLSALLHDASEAYLCDIASPIKSLLSNYKDIENNLMNVIASKFGIVWPPPAAVKEIDAYMLEWEWSSMVLQKQNVTCYTPDLAERIFLRTFKLLTQ
jgi:5'-deoxynucleotidase YfbR-like HD superfamily hydrolase